MKTIYIQFDEPKNDNQTAVDITLKGLFKKIVIKILTSIIPTANPDYENEFDNVVTWLVEIDEESGTPEREIGLDKNSNIILKMPYKNNYGYWIDNNLVFDDFIRLFNAKEIDKIAFEKKWNIVPSARKELK